MKIAILYICTGKYDIFWKDFYVSAEKHLLSGHEKHYFVFTDSDDLYNKEDPRIHISHLEAMGWPYSTLFRFKTFMTKKEELKEFDYIYFFNANMVFVAPVGEEILPSEKEGLVVARHSYFYKRMRYNCPYDRNKDSLAYVPWWKGRHYVQGSLNGGTKDAYLELIRTLDANIQDDLDRDVIALWHDESHLNKYILNRKYKVLSPAYNFAEEKTRMPFTPKIIVRDKRNWGGNDFLRDPEIE